jgi:hypothetical protein
MGYQYPRRVYTGGFPVPGGVPKKPGGSLYPYTPEPSRFRNKPRRNVNHPARNFQLFTEFPHRRRIPPTFLSRTYTMFHMEASQNKVFFSPHLCQGRKHGRRISPPGNHRQESRSPRPFPQGILHDDFKSHYSL